MAGNFPGNAHLSIGAQPDMFLIGNPFCVLGLLKDQSTAQSSYAAQWGGPTNLRQLDIGTPGGGFPKTVRVRYRAGPDILISGAIPEDEWFAFCYTNTGGGLDVSNTTLRMLTLSTGDIVSDSRIVNFEDRPDLTEPVQFGNRNLANSIPLIGAYGVVAVLNRVIAEDEFRHWAYHPVAALQLFRQDALQVHLQPGLVDTATGLTPDLSGQNLHATKLDVGVITPIDGPPVDMTGPMWGRFQPVEAGPPPTFVAAWAKQSTIGAGFETAA